MQACYAELNVKFLDAQTHELYLVTLYVIELCIADFLCERVLKQLTLSTTGLAWTYTLA